MTPADFLNALHKARATAILRTHLPNVVAPAMEAAIRGGFRICEFTLTTPNALQHIAEFSQRADVIVGAGTVLSPEEAHQAIDAGAAFLVSPVVDQAVIAVALERGVTAMPGAFTATEMLQAHRGGAQLQKLFPAPGIGPNYLKAMLGPMPFLRIVPTNGVHLNNLEAWQKAGAFAVGFTTNLFDPNDLAAGTFDRIEHRARALLTAAGADRSSVTAR